MYKDLLAQTPLIALPLAALFIFVAVFFFVVARAMTSRKDEMAKAASMPLDDTNDLAPVPLRIPTRSAKEEGRHVG